MMQYFCPQDNLDFSHLATICNNYLFIIFGVSLSSVLKINKLVIYSENVTACQVFTKYIPWNKDNAATIMVSRKPDIFVEIYISQNPESKLVLAEVGQDICTTWHLEEHVTVHQEC
jgi:hypothetical protein